jgi:hypothetical protein
MATKHQSLVHSPNASHANTAHAFLVVHHCSSPFLKSAPRLAWGSFSAALHPGAANAANDQLRCKVGVRSAVLLPTADSDDQAAYYAHQQSKDVQDQRSPGLLQELSGSLQPVPSVEKLAPCESRYLVDLTDHILSVLPRGRRSGRNWIGI